MTAVSSATGLRWAAIGFALATGYNSGVAIREDLPGEPLGVRVPISVRTGILAGWGSCVAAPWPMPLVGLLAMRRLAQGKTGNKAGHVCAGLGAAGLIGILIEPNTYRAANWTRHTRRAVHLHVASCATLVGAGLWHARPRVNRHPGASVGVLLPGNRVRLPPRQLLPEERNSKETIRQVRPFDR